MNNKLDPQNKSHEHAHQTSDEMDHRGWPGDGSGEDDLADLMAHGDEGCFDNE